MTYFIQLINENLITIHSYTCSNVFEKKIISRQESFQKAITYLKMKKTALNFKYVPCSCCDSEKPADI